MNHKNISYKTVFVLLCVIPVFFCGCSKKPEPVSEYELLRRKVIEKFGHRVPELWAENVPGVKSRLGTDKKVLALTLDACGSENDNYDAELIEFLNSEKVPATLFINARWIDKYPYIFKELAANPLFEIENHGLEHKPCSVNGKSIYGLEGTKNVGEVVDEIEKNGRKIAKLTGRQPIFYRSGTAYYDEVGAEIAEYLGYNIAGFSVLGDAGATYSKDEVKEALLSAQAGDVIICHMNHPEKQTGEGIAEAIPELKKLGFVFVRLDGK